MNRYRKVKWTIVNAKHVFFKITGKGMDRDTYEKAMAVLKELERVIDEAATIARKKMNKPTGTDTI